MTLSIFIRVLAICMSSLGKCPFRPFAHFLNWVVCLPGVEFYKFFIYFGNNPLQDVSLANMFSHTVGSLFPFLLMGFFGFGIFFSFFFLFAVQKKVFNLMWSNLFIFFLYFPCPRRHISKNIATRDV